MTLLEQQIWEKLKDCNDPEIPCNIVDLGLVYEVHVEGQRANVRMTLTTPSCPMSDQITGQIRRKLLELPGIAEANVQLVYDPPWTPALANLAVRKQLGLP